MTSTFLKYSLLCSTGRFLLLSLLIKSLYLTSKGAQLNTIFLYFHRIKSLLHFLIFGTLFSETHTTPRLVIFMLIITTLKSTLIVHNLFDTSSPKR